MQATETTEQEHMNEQEYTPEYRKALEDEEQTRRHLDTCTKPSLECGICFRQAVHEMVLMTAGLGKRAKDRQKEGK